MRKIIDVIQLSASDLVGHLNCSHLTELDLSVASGTLKKPHVWDPLLEILRERGHRHEQDFVEHLRGHGLKTISIDGVDITEDAVTQTRVAMESGADVIIQAALRRERWSGRADILRRVEKPSSLGTWSYEIIDTKLARETKAGSVLQLCLYADLLDNAQGIAPEFIYIVAPWSHFEPQQFRYADYAAYFRKAKAAIEHATLEAAPPAHYPEPKEHCDICRWRERCEERRRKDDHLCLVAGISKNQTQELQENGINTASALASMPVPMPWKPQRGSPLSYEKAREQARIQIESREAGEIKYELLPVAPETGLCLLPEPSEGDIFFDIESDAFVGEHGLEYLFGYTFRNEVGEWTYTADWAFDREAEKSTFERFVDFVSERRKKYPDLHIYHYAPYEPGALKRLMGRYATRENEIDNFLRGEVLVDLYGIVRNALRAGVESYSIKKLEPIYGFKRQTGLPDANIALKSLQAGLELGDPKSISDENRATVQGYNEDDCTSTLALRDWLEARRQGLIDQGNDVPRPVQPIDQEKEELSERQLAIQELIARLTLDVPADIDQRSEKQQACWDLAYLLEWHWREEKAGWWEYFRLAELTPEELIDERAALSYLSYVETIETTARGIPTDRYVFPQQDTDLRGGESLRSAGGEPFGSVEVINSDARTVDIKKMGKTKDLHPDAVYAFESYNSKEQANAIFRIAEHVAEHGIEGDGPFLAARSLLLREKPRIAGEPLRKKDEDTLRSALRIADHLDGGVLPIQGPPGTGKTHTGARMICRLVERGLKVGITANSHKVIRNLLNGVVKASHEMGTNLRCIQKPGEQEPDQDRLVFAKKNDDVFAALGSGRCQVAGGTSFLWAREDAHETLDVLVVDEAAQMSLANVVAVSQAAKTLILLGDPQQLDQPSQGSHPDGTDASSLQHILGEEHTIGGDRGLFLEQTWRLHPEICAFNSELFYDEKLHSKTDCEQQKIVSEGPIKGSGLRYLSVSHTGNKSFSIEEAEATAQLVSEILSSNPSWIDRDGETHELTLDDILIITPYNAQVFEIQQRLPQARVGTVDKFQGQEAPIAIYSMATSSHADAPRGMEFLYSANRFNVAMSRAQCAAILVASPDIFEAECKTPRQMQLANAFCRYLEMSEEVKS
ncbi:TM0106 family RecB-like putative nuclease [Tritonibacter mobilis]|uniref:TM0106 family RecB-like putative nuclease n=1 Tax=Tritonibacter mobilis TaxID=379347 RepID=UPI001C085710|nr:TM0106 family RecB-like putative nuclease [Tritonibacter mobilis]MBU3036478.1 TM0106 family RecB-like putative nuclease [Tritonibacter mobilis]WHQ84219.1 TM0106 family RecB-like putative nuclease [Tritonibacter mobilis]